MNYTPLLYGLIFCDSICCGIHYGTAIAIQNQAKSTIKERIKLLASSIIALGVCVADLGTICGMIQLRAFRIIKLVQFYSIVIRKRWDSEKNKELLPAITTTELISVCMEIGILNQMGYLRFLQETFNTTFLPTFNTALLTQYIVTMQKIQYLPSEIAYYSAIHHWCIGSIMQIDKINKKSIIKLLFYLCIIDIHKININILDCYIKAYLMTGIIKITKLYVTIKRMKDTARVAIPIAQRLEETARDRLDALQKQDQYSFLKMLQSQDIKKWKLIPKIIHKDCVLQRITCSIIHDPICSPVMSANGDDTSIYERTILHKWFSTKGQHISPMSRTFMPTKPLDSVKQLIDSRLEKHKPHLITYYEIKTFKKKQLNDPSNSEKHKLNLTTYYENKKFKEKQLNDPPNKGLLEAVKKEVPTLDLSNFD